MENRSDLIDELLSTYLELPVRMVWENARGLPFPDTFENARVEFQGIATQWLELQQIVCLARQVRIFPGLPARLVVEGPGLEIAFGQEALDRWLSRFQLPYRIVLGEDALVVHTEIAGFPLAEFETTIEVEGGWFVLRPQRTSFLGMPGYVSSLFRTYLPIPPLSSESRLIRITHAKGSLRLAFALKDFDEVVSPGLLLRLRKRFFPLVDQLTGIARPSAPHK
jgi:hypothetical protein